jgi:hypothetical protein
MVKETYDAGRIQNFFSNCEDYSMLRIEDFPVNGEDKDTR